MNKGLRAELFLAAVVADGGFDSTLHALRVVTAEPGRVVCRLHVDKQLQNRYGTLHGGCIATLVDVVGSAALVTQSDRGGVSLAINTLYLNPMPGGEDVEVDARVVKLGRDIGTVEVVLRRASSGELVASGTHVKKLVAASDLSPLFKLLEEQQQQQQQQGQQEKQQQQQAQGQQGQEPASQQQQQGQQALLRPRSKL